MQRPETRQSDDALETMWAEHREHLKRLLIGLSRDRDLADDLLQETYLRAHAGIASYRDVNAGAWLAVIAKNAFYQHVRRRYVRSEMPLDDIPRADAPAPDQAVLLDLNRAIANLSPLLRETLVMKHFGGFTYNEIAGQMGCPVGTAKRRVWAAIRKLKTALGVEEAAAMKCSDLAGTRILDYLYGALSGKQSDSVRSHIEGCPECARKAEELRRLMTALDAVGDDYKNTRIVDLDAAGMPMEYSWWCFTNSFKRAMKTNWWMVDKDTVVEYAAYQGEEVTLEVSPSSDRQYKYEAPLPHPVAPGEKVHSLLVCHPRGPGNWAEKIGDGKWRYSFKTTPNSSKEWVFVLAVRLPEGAQFLNADPEPADKRSDGTTTLTWRSMLPELTAQLREEGRQWQFECTMEYRLDETSMPEPLERPEPSLKWAPEVAFKIDDTPWRESGARALELFQEAGDLSDAYYRTWFKLGLILYDGGYYDEALQAFRRVGPPPDGIVIEFQFAALVWQGHILDLLGRREEALEQYRLALDMDTGEDDCMQHDQYGLVINRDWVEQRLRTPFERK